MGKRIAFTGGSGVVGRTVVPYLVDRGHKVLNLDLKPLDARGVNTVVVNLADSGETFDGRTTRCSPRTSSPPITLSKRPRS
jgi:nucleoside-diphosphate-sugar epimerase